jgi:regulatory protein
LRVLKRRNSVGLFQVTGRRAYESYATRRARRAEIEDPAVVLEAALRFLEARQRSVGEVRRRLSTAGYREDLITGAIERLADLGVLDDGAFAAQWVESRDRARPRGERALQAELRQKGIDSETIARTLEERRGPDGDHDDGTPSPDEIAARRLLERHAGALSRVADPRARRQRAYALLARNGFGSDICRDVAIAWLQEREAGDGLPGAAGDGADELPPEA